MADYAIPKNGVAFIFYGCLVSQADTKLFKSAPTLAAGDFKVAIDGGAFANLATTPTNTPGTFAVKFSLSSGEMTGDNILVVASDAAGAEWCDQCWNIQTAPRGVGDLAYPATSGRSMVVDANGLVDANTVKLGPTGAGTAQTAKDVGGAVPAVAAGASGGLLISGINSGTTTLGALTVTGATTLTGAVALQSTLGITGAVTLSSTLTTGAVAITTLTASGAVAFQSTFAVTTSSSLGAISGTTLTLSGTTSLAAVTTSGTVTLNALTVTNATTLSGAVSLGSTLGVTGTTTLAAVNTGAVGVTTITASGTVSLAAVTTSGTVTLNALTVSNATTLSGAVSLGSTLGITGTTTLAALNTGAIGTGNVTITGTLSTSGTTTLNALTVTNAVTAGSITNNGTLTQTGATTYTGTVGYSNGISVIGGSNTSALVLSAAAGGHGLLTQGNTTGHGISAIGGATGHGMKLLGGFTSGDGLNTQANGAGDGIEAVGTGGGFDINADIQGNLIGSVNSVTTGVTVSGTVTVGTNNDKTGYTLSAAGITAVWAEVMAGTTTAVQAMRGFMAALLGKASGLPTAPKYRDIADTKNVIAASTDTDGNRSSVTLDLTP